MIVAHQHPAPTTPAVPVVRSVSINDAAVSPTALVVAPGTDVTWTNVGRNRHTTTADAGAWDSPTLIPGDKFTITAPSTPGVYAYHCRFHLFIRGTLTVSLVSLETPGSVVVGGRPAFAGTVPDAPDDTPVTVEQRVPGAWVTIATTTTDASGTYQIVGPPLTTRTAFRAVSGTSVSPAVRASVRPAVIVRRRGARLSVRTRPALAGPVHLERLDLDTYGWNMVAERGLSAGQARFVLRAPGVYRAVVEARRGLSDAASRLIQFRPGAFHL